MTREPNKLLPAQVGFGHRVFAQRLKESLRQEGFMVLLELKQLFALSFASPLEASVSPSDTMTTDPQGEGFQVSSRG